MDRTAPSYHLTDDPLISGLLCVRPIAANPRVTEGGDNVSFRDKTLHPVASWPLVFSYCVLVGEPGLAQYKPTRDQAELIVDAERSAIAASATVHAGPRVIIMNAEVTLAVRPADVVPDTSQPYMTCAGTPYANKQILMQ